MELAQDFGQDSAFAPFFPIAALALGQPAWGGIRKKLGSDNGNLFRQKKMIFGPMDPEGKCFTHPLTPGHIGYSAKQVLRHAALMGSSARKNRMSGSGKGEESWPFTKRVRRERERSKNFQTFQIRTAEKDVFKKTMWHWDETAICPHFRWVSTYLWHQCFNLQPFKSLKQGLTLWHGFLCLHNRKYTCPNLKISYCSMGWS